MWLEQSKCYHLWMQVTKIYFVNFIIDFLNVWDQLKEPMMQNFLFFQVKRMEYPGILAQKFIFHPRPWGNLWHWNKSALFLVTVIRQNNVNMIKKKASIILFTLSKDMPIVLGIVYFSICFWLRLQKAAARIHTVIGVVVIKVYCDYKHRVHKIFSC